MVREYAEQVAAPARPPAMFSGRLDKPGSFCNTPRLGLTCFFLGGASYTSVKPESLIELVGSGNSRTIEEEWMKLVESPDLSTEALAKYDVVLSELGRTNQASAAAALAWAALESLSGRCPPLDTLTVACPFLLAVAESQELREQVVTLFRSAYPDFQGLDELLAESGLGGGRPVRRAIRTLELALALNKSDFLAGRDEDSAARVENIDRITWKVAITGPEGEETLGIVHLADQYRPAKPNEFTVLRCFSPDELAVQLVKNPTAIMIDLCRNSGTTLDSDTLEAMLVPDFIAAADWKKWWTKTRGALKKCSNIKIEGRSPHYLTYVDEPDTLESELVTRLRSAYDPIAKLACVTAYLRDVKARGEQANGEILQRCALDCIVRAEKIGAGDAPDAVPWRLAARQMAELGELDGVADGAVECLSSTSDLAEVFSRIDDASLLDLACRCLIEARPDSWQEHLSELLPTFPLTVCERAAERLVASGWSAAEFEPVIQTIMASPLDCFEALLWLWDGPTHSDCVPVPQLHTILSRMVRALDACRRHEGISKEVARKLASRARAVLSARKYDRFRLCLDNLDAGLGRTLRGQIDRLDNLGRAVRSDLDSELRKRFPKVGPSTECEPWELEDVLYVSSDGFARKQDEIDHLVNVQMKENAKAIGRAAEHGDLSENSEYKFALEERDLLRARLAQMNSELAMARVIPPDDVPTDHVGIGTRVTLKRTTDGERYEVAIVGAWDADGEKRWLNYRAPLAMKLLGLHLGDTVDFDHSAATGTYEITALECALTSEKS